MVSRGKALVVDDYSDWREELKEFLQDKGFEVITASDRDAALSVLRSESFDVAVVDVNLTDEARDVDGLIINQYIQENTPDVRVILISARSLDAQEFGNASPATFLMKANLWRELNSLLERVECSTMVQEEDSEQEQADSDSGE
ncbi:MAG: response regulator [Anaerolineae bacterium]|jgi:DNA-binding NtrC family response regulator